MKKLLGIFYVLLLMLVLTGCKDKYDAIYCDFDAGDFKTEGYYYLRTLDEVKKFKVEHNASADMSKKLHYDEKFFKDKYVIVLILPEASADVSYKIESINYKTSTLDIVIKKSSKEDTTKPDTKPGDGNTNNDNNSNGEGNNGTIMDKAEDIIDNIGDSITGDNSNNNGTGNTTPDDNQGNNQNGTNNPTIPDENQGGTTPPTQTNLVNKAFILEFKKTDTVTKINYKIV